MTRRVGAVALLLLVGLAATGAVASPPAVAGTGPSDAIGTATAPGGAVSGGPVTAVSDPVVQIPLTRTPMLQAQQNDGGNATRDGDDLVLSVNASHVGADGNATTIAVEVPAANGSTTAEATRVGDRFVARLPVTAVVPPTAAADLSNATVLASHGGTTVLDDVVDLRYVESAGPVTFENATLAIPADVRGLGDATLELSPGGNASPLETSVEDVGPNATIRVPPDELAGIRVNETVVATAVVGSDAVSRSPVSFSVLDAAQRATGLGYVNGSAVVRQPLAHPAIGPERIGLTVATDGPRGIYHVSASDEDGLVTVPAIVLGASSHSVTVEGDGRVLLADVGVSAPGRPTVSLRIENGSLHAPEPAALAGYDALLLRDGNVSHVPIGDRLRAGLPRPLPASIAEPSQDATALLVGDDARPARVDLTVVPPPSEPSPDPEPPDPDEDAFVGLWVDVGTIVGLLFLAMVGSAIAVGSVYGLRRLSPARSAVANARGVLAHFLLGGAGGAAAIAVVQVAYWEPVLGSVGVLGTEVGLGAVLVGGFHGGLTATGLRVGLGTVGAWPTRRVVEEVAVPVRVRFTDDEGGSLPGEQQIEVRRAGDGELVDTAALAGTTTEVELPPGEYAIAGLTAERETDPATIEIEEPTTPRPETRAIHLTLGRPGLQVEVTDAETGDPVPAGQVTVTTDREETKAATIEDGTVTTTLPIATGTVSAVVSAEGYDEATVETPIEEALTTVDVALDPAAGTLAVTASIAGQPIEGATVAIEPVEASEPEAGAVDAGGAGADDETPASESPGESAVASPSSPEIGVRTAEETTDEDGRVAVELPAGRYRARLVLDGPNADRFSVQDGQGAVQADAETGIAVYGRFDWEPAEPVRRRAAGLQRTIQSVAAEATADPTIPLYFAGVTEALIDCVESLPAAGHHFATSTQDPDEVAAATVAAAEAALEAVGQAMQADGVRPVLASGTEPVRVSPDLEATPADLLAYLEQDLTVASVEARAHEVESVVDAEAERLRSVAPPRAVIGKAVALVPDGDSSTNAAAREFAALLLLDAVEQCFARSSLRARLDGSA